MDLATTNMKMSNEAVFEKGIIWKEKYLQNIMPVWNIAYKQTQEDKMLAEIYKSTSHAHTTVEPINEK